ncbi:cytoplasmic aconitate hydratase-like [Diaphorina citri]|uniref:Cytoplasmic aconitate hydratase-like n=1 Tax=Diaphorina citri TaxID=121845 RepID=A0A3Q0JB04_DIACI|nr:cytoplasmic aconitate hydratase-like [Diaphorina citri]
MRDAVKSLNGDPQKINPICPSDLVIDHSVQVDFSRSSSALEKNENIEFQRNGERFKFLKWGAKAFRNMLIVPPGSGIVHQVNLEYLARVVFTDGDTLYPDSVVGTDSHTTMINGLGVVGWGVGGIEAEAVMLGQAISLLLPEVIGYKIEGKLSQYVTSNNFFNGRVFYSGFTCYKDFQTPGFQWLRELSIADRATISNMCPEYGATVGFFPVDQNSLEYLKQTNRSDAKVAAVKAYLESVKLLRDYSDPSQDPVFSQVVTLDLATVVSSVSGPKRPHDRVPVTDMKQDFLSCLTNKVRGNAPEGQLYPWDLSSTYIKRPPFFDGMGRDVTPGDRVIEQARVLLLLGDSVTTDHISPAGSIARTSAAAKFLASKGLSPPDFNSYGSRRGNDDVMVRGTFANIRIVNKLVSKPGLLAKKAVEAGLSVAPYIKTSLSPGSGVVTYYLRESQVIEPLNQLGFDVVGFGCMTCIGNSGPLDPPIVDAIEKNKRDFSVTDDKQGTKSLFQNELVVAGVLSGNRNFEGLLAKKAVEAGLSVAPYIKTSLSPGSGVVTYYLRESQVIEPLNQLGFDVVGFGCMTCIGNSGPLDPPIVDAIEKNELIVAGVLSGNRNFEGRIHPNTRANYLASPLLVIAYALAGTVDIDFEKEPIGTNKQGAPVFLRDIWPSRSEIHAVEKQHVDDGLFMLSFFLQVDDGRKFSVILRFDTEVDILYYKHGGILNYMIRKML